MYIIAIENVHKVRHIHKQMGEKIQKQQAHKHTKSHPQTHPYTQIPEHLKCCWMKKLSKIITEYLYHDGIRKLWISTIQNVPEWSISEILSQNQWRPGSSCPGGAKDKNAPLGYLAPPIICYHLVQKKLFWWCNMFQNKGFVPFIFTLVKENFGVQWSEMRKN